jgi:hypothetical protein
VVGEVETGSSAHVSLMETLSLDCGGDCVHDLPELALPLLAATLKLCARTVPLGVRDWLDGTLGPGFSPSELPTEVPGLDAWPIPQREMPRRARRVIEACPSWLDRSPLTFQLAEEIGLRKEGHAIDPVRDAGAYRFLFEHHLIHRVELYRRMLLWMAWLWRFSGDLELARSALALCCQLSDEQYVVPSHPFILSLTTRSFESAQAWLRAEGKSRSGRAAE